MLHPDLHLALVLNGRRQWSHQSEHHRSHLTDFKRQRVNI